MGFLSALAVFASMFLVGLGLWSVVKIEESLEDIEYDFRDCSGCEGDCGCC